MKIGKAIEDRFRNTTIEYQVVAYGMKVSPTALASLKAEWLSIVTLRDLVAVLKKLKVTLTKEAAAEELRKVDASSVELYEEMLATLQKQKVKALSAKSIQILISQIYDLYESRRCLYGVLDLTKAVRDDSFDIKKAKKLLKDLARDYGVFNEHTGDYLEDFEVRVEMVKERAKTSDDEQSGSVIPTGIVRFDQLIGGMMPTEWGVIAGRTGVGKTAMLIWLALYAWSLNFSVVFATGEMSKDLIEFRMDSNIAGIPQQKFRTGELDKDEWLRWRKAIKQLRMQREGFLEVVAFPRNFTALDIEGEIVRLQDMRERRVDLLCIDYLNIMNPAKAMRDSSTKEWASQADVVWDVKGLTADLMLRTWTAGQITDAGYDADRLQLDHIKYARAISETAPMVVGLVQTEDDKQENRLQFQVLKMRNTAPLEQSIYLHPNLQVMRIHERATRVKDLKQLEDDLAEKTLPDASKRRTRKKRL